MRYLIGLFLISFVFAFEPIAKLEMVNEVYIDKPKYGFFDNDTNPSITASIGANGYLHNCEYKVVLSNKYDDTYIDTAVLTTDFREDKFLYGSKIGTISTLKGIFDLQKGADEQAPLIGGENAIYTNRLRKGGFEQNVGVEPYIGFLFKDSIVKIRYLYSHMRVLSEKKLDVGILGYNSPDTEIEVSKPFQGAGISIFKGDYNFFYDDVITSLQLKTDMSDTEIFTSYISNPALFDYALMAANKGETDINIVRYGVTKQNSRALIGYEHIYYNQKNKEIGLDKGNYADNLYIAYYGLRNIVPYVMYGESMRLRNDKVYGSVSQEQVIGARYRFNHHISVLGEFRNTDWWQTYDMIEAQDTKQYITEGKDINMFSMLLIYNY